MNVAYPQCTFDTDVAAIEGFADLLRGGFENPEGVTGLVRVTIPEYPEQSFIARYACELHVERNDMN